MEVRIGPSQIFTKRASLATLIRTLRPNGKAPRRSSTAAAQAAELSPLGEVFNAAMAVSTLRR